MLVLLKFGQIEQDYLINNKGANMEKELKDSLARYAEIEKKLIENKKARLALSRSSDEYKELAEEAVRLRDEYMAEEKVRNELVIKVELAKAKGDK